MPELSPFTGLQEIIDRESGSLQRSSPSSSPSLPVPPKPKRIRKPKPKALPPPPPDVDVIEPQPPEEPEEEEQRPAKRARTSRKKPVDLSTRDDEDRKTIALLTAYGANVILGPYLRDVHAIKLDPAKLRSMSKAKLEELLADVEDVLANKGNSAIADALVRQALSTLEALVEYRAGLLVKGTTDTCFENEHWRFLLERAKMKHGIGYGKLDPVIELSLITFQTGALVHAKRSMETCKTDLEAPYVPTPLL